MSSSAVRESRQASPLTAAIAIFAAAVLLAGATLLILRLRAAAYERAPRAVPLRIDISRVLAVSGADFDGVNLCALWNDTEDDPGAVAAFAAMRQRLLRFPGGVPAEYYDWSHPLASGWTQLTPDRVWRMARVSGARLIFQTDAATSSTGINKSTGAAYHFDNSGVSAADWVRAAKAAGMDVAYWEIGNEPELDAPVGDKSTQQAIYDWYDTKFAEQASAMKAANPAAKTMGPASANAYYWWGQGDLDRFLAAEGNRQGTGLVDAVSVHWYPHGGDGPWERERGVAEEWSACMSSIENSIARHDTRPLPVIVSEWNFGGGMNNRSASTMANALGSADCIGMFRRTGVAGETFFTLQHIDHGWGVLATRKDEKPINEPSPTYFALEMASHLLPRSVAVDGVTDPANDLSAYATTDGRGRLAIMMINKSGGIKTVPLTFAHFSPVGTAKVYSLAGARCRIADTDVIYNGRRWTGWRAGMPPPVAVPAAAAMRQKLAPYSMKVIVFSGGD